VLSERANLLFFYLVTSLLNLAIGDTRRSENGRATKAVLAKSRRWLGYVRYEWDRWIPVQPNNHSKV
jgi:hypothetical protein